MRVTNLDNGRSLIVRVDDRPQRALAITMLPGGGGFSVARRLKELQPDCTVVMFSAAPVGHQAADSPDVDEFVMKGDVRVIRRMLDDLARRLQPGV